ncbi:MAG: hypothetical protein JW722_00020 [Demequinaceae bacterium]|nr:hypothetical protein [Demequinaceae bacterium]
MEAFEQFVALAIETEGFVVSGPHKFRVTKRTAKQAYDESQTHGYEVDLVGARSDRLVLATVKSFFGSGGVKAADVIGTGKNASWYRMLNDVSMRDEIVSQATHHLGYRVDQVELRLYAGKFGGVEHQRAIREWCATQVVGASSIKVFSADEVVDAVRPLADQRQYRDNPVIVSMKVLLAAGALKPRD